MKTFDKMVRKTINEFNRYKELKKKNRIIELPCNIGDEFYIIAYSKPKVIKVICTGYNIAKDIKNIGDCNNKNILYEKNIIWVNSIERPQDYWELPIDEFDFRTFKTEEEANKAFKEYYDEEI